MPQLPGRLNWNTFRFLNEGVVAWLCTVADVCSSLIA